MQKTNVHEDNENLDKQWIGEDNIYRENILDHYKHPRNFGVTEGASATHKEINHACGDEIRVFVHINNNKITDITFTGKGCAISIASASMLTQHIKGKTIEDARAMKDEDMMRLLGIQLGIVRKKCGTLALKILHKCVGGI